MEQKEELFDILCEVVEVRSCPLGCTVVVVEVVAAVMMEDK